MSTPRFLALIATEMETAAGASSSANASDAGYWKRIAVAAEVLAGAVTTANAFLTGYMKRAAAAVITRTGFSGTGYNQLEEGYLAQIVAALEFDTGTTTTGSLESRFYELISGSALASLRFDSTTMEFDNTSHSWDEG